MFADFFSEKIHDKLRGGESDFLEFVEGRNEVVLLVFVEEADDVDVAPQRPLQTDVANDRAGVIAPADEFGAELESADDSGGDVPGGILGVDGRIQPEAIISVHGILVGSDGTVIFESDGTSPVDPVDAAVHFLFLFFLTS